MRESRAFAKRTRTRESREAKRRYFLVYEGKETELRYFEAVNELRAQIGIDPLIELKPLIRSFSEDGWSNPKKILQRVMLNLEESRTGRITYETLLNRVIDYLIDENIISSRSSQTGSIWNILIWLCEKKLGVELHEYVEDEEAACVEICRGLRERANITGAVSQLVEIIESERITYEKGFDKICLIVDRDKGSFMSSDENNQYEYVLNTCRENGFGFYLTNPCFEFWLLLHFDEVAKIDRKLMLLNPKVSRRRTYAAEQLHRLMPHYHKAEYDAGSLVRRVDKAIKNEKMFCENIEKLEYRLGSNVGTLIEELKG